MSDHLYPTQFVAVDLETLVREEKKDEEVVTRYNKITGERYNKTLPAKSLFRLGEMSWKNTHSKKGFLAGLPFGNLGDRLEEHGLALRDLNSPYSYCESGEEFTPSDLEKGSYTPDYVIAKEGGTVGELISALNKMGIKIEKKMVTKYKGFRWM